eukprot:gene13167-17641_t
MSGLQVDPFYIRYCPAQPEDEGEYIIKVFAAVKAARFYWEISWQVMEESTMKWYKGDFSTKMIFNFNATTSTFLLTSIENEIKLDAPCYRCVFVARSNWDQLQETGNAGFWPLVVTGAPYYISDIYGRKLYFMGKVCEGVYTYECYQRLTNGLYILRVGGGLFGRLLEFPTPTANWIGCGENGTDRDQLIFQIKDQKCTPIQKFRYDTRCSQPDPINIASYSGTKAPTSGGTIAPSQSTFGNPYVKFQMYSINSGGTTHNYDNNKNNFGHHNSFDENLGSDRSLMGKKQLHARRNGHSNEQKTEEEQLDYLFTP